MSASFQALVVGALLGATIGFVGGQFMATSHSEAMAMAAALAPEGSTASPTREIDYPFWYGGRYQAEQTFTGGARDRPHLTELMREQLEREGWQIVGVDERPGATLITAVEDDMEVVVHASSFPFDPVEGIVKVMYRYEPPTAMLVLVGAASGVAATAARRLTSLRL